MCVEESRPLVRAVRFLLQDFWTVMSKDDMALTDPDENPVPIACSSRTIGVLDTDCLSMQCC